MPRVLLWEGHSAGECEVLLVRASDFSEFSALTAAGEAKISAKRLLRILPAQEKDTHLAVLYCLLRYCDGGESEDVAPNTYSALLGASEQFRRACARADIAGFEQALSDVKRLSPADLGSLVNDYLELIADYFRTLVQSISSRAPYETQCQATRRPIWWASRPAIRSDFESLAARMRKRAADYPMLSSLAERVRHAAELVARLQKTSSSQEPFVIASAWCFVAAGAVRDARQWGGSLLLLHRSLEYALLAVAVEANSVELSQNGARFAGRSEVSEQVGLWSLQRRLVDEGILASNEGRRGLIKTINATRNELLYTHGLSSVSQAEVTALFGEVVAVVKGLEPTGLWVQAVKALSPQLTLPPHFLFSASPIFEGGFEVQRC